VVTVAGEDANAPRLIDRDVMLSVNGMQECIIGSMNWSFVTKRYFDDNGGSVKAATVGLLTPARKRKRRLSRKNLPR